MKRLAGLIVAGGYSRRMGAFKPLLPLLSQTVLETTVASLLSGGIDNICVVTGHQAGQLSYVLRNLPVTVVYNSDYATGMFSSVRAGFLTLKGEADAIFFLPGDTPLIRRSTVKALRRAYCAADAPVLYPSFNGRRGHPPLIDDRCFPYIFEHDGAEGLRGVLAMFEQEAVSVPVADRGIRLDLDTPADYANMLCFSREMAVPDYEECCALLGLQRTDASVIQHGKAVAAVAFRLASLLNQTGGQLNLKMVMAGGLLHDLAKGSTHHALRGARRIAGWGFPALSAVVAAHMELPEQDDERIDETRLVFLADKLVRETRFVSLEERFAPALSRFADNEALWAAIRRKYVKANCLQTLVWRRLQVTGWQELGFRTGGVLDETGLF